MNNKTSEANIMVSIFCLAYNHENYIREALESFVRQKADFKFEVLVHDDASTDATADIIREYEAKYPEIIRPVYQTENQYSKHIANTPTHLLPRARGKYVAWCEGDDYWTDDQKLQIQVEALENNPTCVACFSKIEKTTADGKPLGKFLPSNLRGSRLMSGEDFVKYLLDPGTVSVFPIQVSGYMMKRELYKEYIYNQPSYRSAFHFFVGDMPMMLYTGTHGDVYYIDRVMSHYRTGISQSFEGKHYYNNRDSAAYLRRKAAGYGAFDAYSDYRFHDECSKAMKTAEFRALMCEHDVKSLKSEEYRELFYRKSRKIRCAQYLLYYCPVLEKPARKLKWYLTNHGIIK